MAIEITLFGFADERPLAFGGDNRLQLEIDTPATPRAVLHAVGIDDGTGLVLMHRDRVVPARDWDETIVVDRDRLTLLAAFEGG